MTNKRVLDYRKEFRDLYMPKDKPMLIVIPSVNFIMCDGNGDPNNNSDFQQAIDLLYGLSFILKEGLRNKVGNGGKHHEIYLSDPRKSKPENMKTVLRQPVEKVKGGNH